MTDAPLRKRVNEAPVVRSNATVPQINATPYHWREPSTIPMRPWVYGYWFLRGTVSCVIAPGGAGKSTLVAGMALSLVTGELLLGKQVRGGPKNVWLWNLEDDADELARSIQAACQHHGIEQAAIDGRLFVDSGLEGATLCTAVEDKDGFKLLEPIYEGLTGELKRRQIDVLFVDPFVSSHQVEENANSKIDPVVKAWARVAKLASCCIVLVHHTSKAGASDVSALSARGAVALINAARAALVINRMTTDDAVTFGIPDHERHQYINVSDDKHNRTPAEKADWFKLVSSHLHNGGFWEGDGDSVGVAVPWSPPKAFDGVTTRHLVEVQARISSGTWWRDQQSKENWAGEIVAAVLSLDSTNPTHKKRIERILKEWIDNKALKVVSEHDTKHKRDRPRVICGEPASVVSTT